MPPAMLTSNYAFVCKHVWCPSLYASILPQPEDQGCQQGHEDHDDSSSHLTSNNGRYSHDGRQQDLYLNCDSGHDFAVPLEDPQEYQT